METARGRAGAPRIAAHRGGAALWPENSLLAFRNAIALGAPLLELDVHLTRDGGIAVFHDRTLERMTDATGPVGDRTLADLAGLRLRDRAGVVTDERVPSLDDVLALVEPSSVSLLLEIKGLGPSFYERAAGRLRPAPGPRYDGLEAAVLGRLRACRLESRTTLMGFNPDVVAEIRRHAPAARTTLLIAETHVSLAQASTSEFFELAGALGVTDLGLEHALATPEVVDRARQRGLTLGVWTVNDVSEMRRCAGLGVDILTTDRPDLAVELFGGAP